MQLLKLHGNNFSLNSDNSLTVTINKPCTNDVEFALDAPSGTNRYSSGRTQATSYTFSAEQIRQLLQYIPNKASISLTIWIVTYGNHNYHNIVTGTLYVVNSNPIFNDFSFENTNTINLTGNKNIFINKYSDIKVIIPTENKMQTKNYATPISYGIVNGIQNYIVPYSDSENVFQLVPNCLSPVVKVFAIDSRNLQTPVEKNIGNVIDYKEIIINSLILERKDNVGTTARIRLTGVYDNVNFGSLTNTVLEVKLRYKKNTENAYSDWINITNLFTFIDGKIENKLTNEIPDIIFDFGFEYNIELYAKDRLSTFTTNTILPSGKVLYSALKGYGVCFGDIYDKNVGGALQINKIKIVP